MPNTVEYILLICALVLLGVRCVLFTGVHFYHREHTPPFTPFRTTLSEYGTGEGRPMFTAMGMVTLLAYVLIAVSLGISHIASWPWLVLLAFAIWSQFMLFLFPMDDLTQEARTRTGKLHSIFALLGFILFYIFVIFVPLSASWAQSGWITSAVVLTHLGFWSMLLVAVIPALRCVVGLAERIYLIAVPYWFLAVAALWLATGY
ncbi:DUF998 domain-containing protein [Lawsonella clevelandensis]|nr:DUF998 domain-containing protein [Lawsonella clevelandensis]MDU7192632.1 DUF998 domain-containing protein [Lawsonella clevelandensis]